VERLRKRAINLRNISWPTFEPGTSRIRIDVWLKTSFEEFIILVYVRETNPLSYDYLRKRCFRAGVQSRNNTFSFLCALRQANICTARRSTAIKFAPNEGVTSFGPFVLVWLTLRHTYALTGGTFRTVLYVHLHEHFVNVTGVIWVHSRVLWQ
jgi:hypothetical protein